MLLTHLLKEKMVFEDKKKSLKMLHLDNRWARNIILMSKVATLPFWNKNLPVKQVKISKDQNKTQLPFLIFKWEFTDLVRQQGR